MFKRHAFMSFTAQVYRLQWMKWNHYIAFFTYIRETQYCINHRISYVIFIFTGSFFGGYLTHWNSVWPIWRRLSCCFLRHTFTCVSSTKQGLGWESCYPSHNLWWCEPRRRLSQSPRTFFCHMTLVSLLGV